MRRIAAHSVYWRDFYPMHYIELGNNAVFSGVFPLEKEMAGIEFYDGLLIPLPINDNKLYSLLKEWEAKDQLPDIKEKIREFPVNLNWGDTIRLLRIHQNKIYYPII